MAVFAIIDLVFIICGNGNFFLWFGFVACSYCSGYWAVRKSEEQMKIEKLESKQHLLCWNDMTEAEKSDFFFDLSHQEQ